MKPMMALNKLVLRFTFSHCISVLYFLSPPHLRRRFPLAFRRFIVSRSNPYPTEKRNSLASIIACNRQRSFPFPAILIGRLINLILRRFEGGRDERGITADRKEIPIRGWRQGRERNEPILIMACHMEANVAWRSSMGIWRSIENRGTFTRVRVRARIDGSCNDACASAPLNHRFSDWGGRKMTRSRWHFFGHLSFLGIIWEFYGEFDWPRPSTLSRKWKKAILQVGSSVGQPFSLSGSRR